MQAAVCDAPYEELLHASLPRRRHDHRGGFKIRGAFADNLPDGLVIRLVRDDLRGVSQPRGVDGGEDGLREVSFGVRAPLRLLLDGIAGFRQVRQRTAVDRRRPRGLLETGRRFGSGRVRVRRVSFIHRWGTRLFGVGEVRDEVVEPGVDCGLVSPGPKSWTFVFGFSEMGEGGGVAE